MFGSRKLNWLMAGLGGVLFWATMANLLWKYRPRTEEPLGAGQARPGEWDEQSTTEVKQEVRSPEMLRHRDEAGSAPLPLQQIQKHGQSHRPFGSHLQPPSIAQLRKDIATNPHLPPARFLDFSLRVAEHVSQAAGDPAFARELMEEFLRIGTAAAGEVPETVAALCLRQAKDLSVLHPELEEQYKRMRSQISSDAAIYANF